MRMVLHSISVGPPPSRALSIARVASVAGTARVASWPSGTDGARAPGCGPDPAAVAAAPAPAEAAPANPQCATARSNIEILLGDGPVQQDDGEGNARELSADERTNQLELARAAARAYCDDADS